MKILLLGKNGQLGREIDSQVRSRGIELCSLGREELDVTHDNQVKKVIDDVKADIVINTTAYHLVLDCEKYPEKAFLVNCFAVKKLAEICRSKKIKFITFSTDYVFDGIKADFYAETDRPNPLQIYGLSKLAGEFVSQNYDPNSLVIRTCGVYGGKMGSREKGGNFILTILKEAMVKKTLEVSSEQIVNPTYAFDLAGATLELMMANAAGGIYHLTNTGCCSWAQFAEEICHIKKLKLKIIPVDKKGFVGGVRRPLFSALSNRKAQSLGIILPSWQNALKRYLNSL